MNKIKLMVTLVVLAFVAGTGAGCLVSEGHHGRRVYDPAGSPRDYRYDRDHRDYDGRYYDHRYERHQWDNPNYRY